MCSRVGGGGVTGVGTAATWTCSTGGATLTAALDLWIVEGVEAFAVSPQRTIPHSNPAIFDGPDIGGLHEFYTRFGTRR